MQNSKSLVAFFLQGWCASMKKRARSVVTRLVAGCSIAAGTLIPWSGQRANASGQSVSSSAVSASVLQNVWTWIQQAAHAVGVFFASVYISIRDFFASGSALTVLESATRSVNDAAVRLLLPISSPIARLISRLLPNVAVTPELTAIWIFWIVTLLILVLLVIALRPRHAAHRLPKVTPRTPGQEENTIQFGMVEQGPQPTVPMTTPDQAARAHEPETQQVLRTPESTEPVPAQKAAVGTPESPSIPEISLEPLGLFGEPPVRTATAQEPARQMEVTAESAAPLLLEPIAPEGPQTEPETKGPTPETAAESQPPVEALLPEPEEATPALEPAEPEPAEAIPEPSLIPLGEQTSAEPEAPAVEMPEPTLQPSPAEQPPEPAPLQEAAVAESPPTLENAVPSAHTEEPVILPEEKTEAAPSVPAAADLLTRLLDEEESFPRAVAQAAQPAPSAQTTPSRQSAPSAEPAPASPPSIFSGEVDLDELLSGGVVTDAGALTQLFHGGYRNRISKLAMSAKDLQNVPEDMRQVVKLTVVALSPIELSIARDLAMRLEAPGFVGEALLVAKKMGYENYLTTYKNISKNYKDVSIVETTSLKVPSRTSESSAGELISFN